MVWRGRGEWDVEVVVWRGAGRGGYGAIKSTAARKQTIRTIPGRSNTGGYRNRCNHHSSPFARFFSINPSQQPRPRIQLGQSLFRPALVLISGLALIHSTKNSFDSFVSEEDRHGSKGWCWGGRLWYFLIKSLMSFESEMKDL